MTTAIGMNDCNGTVCMEISGGKFTGDVYAISRMGSNMTGDTATYGGNITLKITGGEFSGAVAEYQDAATPKAVGTVILLK